MRRERHLHVRLTEEEYHLFDILGINKSKWVREKIKELKMETPEKLRERERELEKELEETRRKRIALEEQLRIKKERNEESLDNIFQDFIKYGRHIHSDSENLEWIKGRYNVSIPPEKIIEYCKKKWREKNDK